MRGAVRFESKRLPETGFGSLDIHSGFCHRLYFVAMGFA
jgi:hypothetical protein